ncbi:MAG: hypothetical protein LH632_02045, partial [Rhodoferax sp.]|nr:hypothetical protein [Rhodoferax sp.]
DSIAEWVRRVTGSVLGNTPNANARCAGESKFHVNLTTRFSAQFARLRRFQGVQFSMQPDQSVALNSNRRSCRRSVFD